MADEMTKRRIARARAAMRARTDKAVGSLLTIDQVWSDRATRERWVVHQVHRADRQVTLRREGVARRRTLSFRELVAGYSLVLLTGKGLHRR